MKVPYQLVAVARDVVVCVLVAQDVHPAGHDFSARREVDEALDLGGVVVGLADQVPVERDGHGPEDVNGWNRSPQAPISIGSQAPISIPQAWAPSRARRTPRGGGVAELGYP